jgi:hypothetical protein
MAAITITRYHSRTQPLDPTSVNGEDDCDSLCSRPCVVHCINQPTVTFSILQGSTPNRASLQTTRDSQPARPVKFSAASPQLIYSARQDKDMASPGKSNSNQYLRTKSVRVRQSRRCRHGHQCTGLPPTATSCRLGDLFHSSLDLQTYASPYKHSPFLASSRIPNWVPEPAWLVVYKHYTTVATLPATCLSTRRTRFALC